jgi:hypothetical protein
MNENLIFLFVFLTPSCELALYRETSICGLSALKAFVFCLIAYKSGMHKPQAPMTTHNMITHLHLHTLDVKMSSNGNCPHFIYKCLILYVNVVECFYNGTVTCDSSPVLFWMLQVTRCASFTANMISSRDTGSEVQGGALAPPWDFHHIIFLFNI